VGCQGFGSVLELVALFRGQLATCAQGGDLAKAAEVGTRRAPVEHTGDGIERGVIG